LYHHLEGFYNPPSADLTTYDGTIDLPTRATVIKARMQFIYDETCENLEINERLSRLHSRTQQHINLLHPIREK